MTSITDLPGTHLGRGTERGAYAYIAVFSGALYTVLLIAPVVAAKISTQFDLSATEVGVLFSCELGAFSLSALPAYLWASRFNLRLVTYCCTAVVVAGNIVSALAPTYPALLVARIVTSIAAGSITVIILLVCGRTTNPGRAFGLFVVAQLATGAVLLAVAPKIFDGSKVGAVYWTLAALTALGFTVTGRIDGDLLRRANRHGDNRSRTEPGRGSGATVRVVLGMSAVLLFYLALSSVWTFVGQLAIDAGLAPGTTSLVLSVATVAGVLSALGATVIGETPHRSTFLVSGYAALTVSIGLLVDAPAPVRFTVAAVVFKFAWTFVLPYLLSSLSSLSESPHVMTTINIMVGAGFAVGPTLAGTIIDRTDGYVTMLISAAAMMVLSTALAWAAVRSAPLRPRTSARRARTLTH